VLTTLCVLASLLGCQHLPIEGLTDLQSQIVHQARIQGVPPHIALAVAEQESRFKPTAMSKGNYGVMQIQLGTARRFGFAGAPKELLDPNTNIKYGIAVLAHCYKKYAFDMMSLGCYNGAITFNSTYIREVLVKSKKYQLILK